MQDIQSLTESSQFASNTYLDGQVYSILSGNLLSFYMISTNQMIQVILPTSIDVQSAKNVFLFEAQPEVLGISGYIVVAFGFNNVVLIHLDAQYQQQYKIISAKEYQHIQSVNMRECLSTVTFGDNQTKTIQKTNFYFQELLFYLGSTMSQKIFQLKVSLQKDSFGGMIGSVMTNVEETLLYQEPKSFTSRISGFLSSKLLGLRGDDEQNPFEGQQCVKNIHILHNFIVAITTKDIIILRRSDGVKVYESEYLESLKRYTSNRDDYENMLLMRELLEFRNIASSATLIQANNQICINIFILKTQVVQNPQSYTTIKQTQIIQCPRILQIHYQDIQERDNSEINFYDVHNLTSHDLLKSFTFSYEVFSNQRPNLLTLMVMEFKDGKSIAIEHSLADKLGNLSLVSDQKLFGYSAMSYIDDSSREQLVSIRLITSKDIDQYEYATARSHFSDVQPEGVIASSGIRAQEQAYSMPQVTKIQDQRIFNREDIKPFIYLQLEQIASYKYQSRQNPRASQEQLKQQILNNVRMEVQKSLSIVTKEEFLGAVQQILHESMNVPINDSHFTNVSGRGDEVGQIFSDDGLVLQSLENKEKKFQVILEFLVENGLYNPEEESDMRVFINDLSFKLFIAKVLRNYQEHLKSNQHSLVSNNTDYPIEMKLLSKVIQLTSAKLGYGASELNSLGVTSANVVYANISRLDEVFHVLLDLSLDSNIQTRLTLSQREDQYSVLNSAALLLNHVFEKALENQDAYLLQDSFFCNENLLQSVVNLCEKIQKGAQEQRAELKESLSTLSDTFLTLLISSGLNNSKEFDTWRNNIVVVLEQSIGKERALECAQKFQACRLLCKLVFDLGSQYYPVLHDCIQNWGPQFLQLSFREIYELEKADIIERKQTRSYEGYRGFQMFDIYEHAYFRELADFLEPRNKKLYCLLSLRQQNAEVAHELLKKEIIPTTQTVEAMKVFSSLAITNSQNCVQAFDQQQKLEDERYFEAKLYLATTQEQVLSQPGAIQPVDVKFLELALRRFNQADPNNLYGSLSQTLQLINDDGFDSQQDNLRELKQYAWKMVLKHDQESIQHLQQLSTNASNDLNHITEKQISEAIGQTLLYTLATENRNSPAYLDEQIQRELINDYQELSAGLRAIFSTLKNSDVNLFSQRSKANESLQMA